MDRDDDVRTGPTTLRDELRWCLLSISDPARHAAFSGLPPQGWLDFPDIEERLDDILLAAPLDARIGSLLQSEDEARCLERVKARMEALWALRLDWSDPSKVVDRPEWTALVSDALTCIDTMRLWDEEIELPLVVEGQSYARLDEIPHPGTSEAFMDGRDRLGRAVRLDFDGRRWRAGYVAPYSA